jgi:hypothetical protein
MLTAPCLKEIGQAVRIILQTGGQTTWRRDGRTNIKLTGRIVEYFSETHLHIKTVECCNSFFQLYVSDALNMMRILSIFYAQQNKLNQFWNLFAKYSKFVTCVLPPFDFFMKRWLPPHAKFLRLFLTHSTFSILSALIPRLGRYSR